MTVRTSCTFPLILLCLCLGGCATRFTADYDYDRSHDFSGHDSWTWISENPMTLGELSTLPNPLLEPRIMSAIEDTFEAKGYTKVADMASADFVVAFTVGSRDRIKVDTYPTFYGGFGYPRRWGGAYYGMSVGTNTQVREYTRGMLAIDIFDVPEQKPMWHGVTEKSITEADRRNVEETIQAAVDAILAGFPPDQG